MAVSITRLLAGALALLALAAPAWAQESVRVGIPQPAFSFLAVDVGLQTGIFARHNLAVEKLVFAGSAKLHQALAAGSIDVAFGAGPEFGFLAKGAPERAVAATANRPADVAITVLADGPIHDVEDLKGRRVSVSTRGSLTEWAGEQLGRAKGWGPDGLVLLPLGAFSGQIAALKTQQIDAIITSASIARRTEEEGSGRVLMTFEHVVDDFHINVIFAADSFIADHPEALRNYLAATREVIDYERAHRAETVALAAQALEMSPALAGTLYDSLMPQANDSLRFRPRALEVLAQAMVDMGEVEQKPDMASLLTEAYLPAQ